MRHLIPAVFCILLPFISSAQALPISWEHTYGGSDHDNAQHLCPAGDGCYIFAGSSQSHDGDITGTMHGIADFLVMKINASGGIMWERTLGGTSAERANTIEPTTDGGFIIAGYTASNTDDVSGNHGGTGDGWLVKLNNAGGIMWQQCYGGSGFDQFVSVIPCSDGGYFAVGTTNSTDGDVVGYGATSSLQDLWAVKLDTAGAIEWQQTMGGTMGAIGRAALQTSDSSYVIAGYTGSTDGDVTGNHGGVDSWIIKLSRSGSVLWKKCYGGTNMDGAMTICPGNGGGFVFAGQTLSTDGDVSHFYGGDINGGDIWVVKIDDTGRIEWEKCFGGSWNEEANSIRQASANRYIIAGWTESRDGDVTGRKDTTDAWVLLIDDAGTLLWQKCLGGTARDRARDIIETPDTGFIVACITASHDSDVSFNNGQDDCWLVKLSGAPPTVVMQASPTNRMQLRPNPTSGKFIIMGESAARATAISITDMSGKTMFSRHYTISPGQFSLPVNVSLPDGVYYVHVQTKERQETIPIVIERQTQ